MVIGTGTLAAISIFHTIDSLIFQFDGPSNFSTEKLSSDSSAPGCPNIIAASWDFSEAALFFMA